MSRARLVVLVSMAWLCLVLGILALLRPIPGLSSHISDLPDDLLASAFGALINDNGSGPTNSAACIAYARFSPAKLQWQYRDPSLEVLARLQRTGRMVRLLSQCRVTRLALDSLEQGAPPARDSFTGRPAIIYTLEDPIVWRGRSAVLNGRYDCGMLCGGSGPIMIQWLQGSWQARFSFESVS